MRLEIAAQTRDVDIWSRCSDEPDSSLREDGFSSVDCRYLSEPETQPKRAHGFSEGIFKGLIVAVEGDHCDKFSRFKVSSTEPWATKITNNVYTTGGMCGIVRNVAAVLGDLPRSWIQLKSVDDMNIMDFSGRYLLCSNDRLRPWYMHSFIPSPKKVCYVLIVSYKPVFPYRVCSISIVTSEAYLPLIL
jgi:hypothetical protein